MKSTTKKRITKHQQKAGKDNIVNNDNTKIEETDALEQAIKTTSISDLIQSPYINTTLSYSVMLHPNQMDNKFYLHLKNNLIDSLVGKCYSNYGYISKIYKIEEHSDPIIEAENPTGSAKSVVKFSCKLCYPAKNREIICKIDRMNKSLIGGINGPLKIIITPDKMNKNNFYMDMNKNIRIKSTSEQLMPNVYIRVLIKNSAFSNYDKEIISIGYLEDIANEKEIALYLQEEHEFNN